jgi:hypothetical protein
VRANPTTCGRWRRPPDGPSPAWMAPASARLESRPGSDLARPCRPPMPQPVSSLCADPMHPPRPGQHVPCSLGRARVGDWPGCAFQARDPWATPGPCQERPDRSGQQRSLAAHHLPRSPATLPHLPQVAAIPWRSLTRKRTEVQALSSRPFHDRVGAPGPSVCSAMGWCRPRCDKF